MSPDRSHWRRAAVIMAVTALCVTTTLYLLRVRQQERFDRMRGAVSTCLGDMYHIGVALALYKEDHRGTWPESLRELVPRYLTQVPACRNARGSGDTYGYVRPTAATPADARVIVCDRHPNVTRDPQWGSRVMIYLTEGGDVEIETKAR